MDILCHSDAGCVVFLPGGICNSLWCFMPGVFAMEVLPMVEEVKTKRCPKCGARMIKRYENCVYLTDPPQYPWNWWCACGWQEKGGIDRGISEEEVIRRIWEEAQKEYGR